MFKACLFLLLFSSLFVPVEADAKLKKWSRYTSDNFTIYTDVNEKKARELINQFEDFHDLVVVLTGTAVPANQERMQVFLFSRRKEFNRFVPRKYLAGFYTHTTAGPRIVMVAEKRGIAGEQVLFHEYVHHIMRSANNFHYPAWYSEGFAEFLGSTEFKRGKATIGAIPKARLADLNDRRSPTVAELLVPSTQERDHGYLARFYAKAWLFVHYLQIAKMSGNEVLGNQLRDYLLRFAQGEDAIEAFSQSFGMTPADMDKQLAQYQNGRVNVFTTEVAKKDRVVNRADVSANESIFLLAELASLIRANDQSLELLTQLDSNKPDAARGLALLGRLKNQTDPEESDRLFDLALSHAPNDPNVMRNKASSHLRRYVDALDAGEPAKYETLETIEAILLKALKMDPKDLEIHLLLWELAAEQDDLLAAAQHMMAAYQLDPTSIKLNYDIGSFLLGQGKPDLALSFLKRVHQWTHDPDAKSRMEELLDQIRTAIGPDGAVLAH